MSVVHHIRVVGSSAQISIRGAPVRTGHVRLSVTVFCLRYFRLVVLKLVFVVCAVCLTRLDPLLYRPLVFRSMRVLTTYRPHEKGMEYTSGRQGYTEVPSIYALIMLGEFPHHHVTTNNRNLHKPKYVICVSIRGFVRRRISLISTSTTP